MHQAIVNFCIYDWCGLRLNNYESIYETVVGLCTTRSQNLAPESSKIWYDLVRILHHGIGYCKNMHEDVVEMCIRKSEHL